jgi:hypothetical protein
VALRSSSLPPWSCELAIGAELEGDLKGRFSGAVGEAFIFKKKVASGTERYGISIGRRDVDSIVSATSVHVRLVISSYSGLPASLVSY